MKILFLGILIISNSVFGMDCYTCTELDTVNVDCFDFHGNIQVKTCNNGGCMVDRVSYYFVNGSALHEIKRGCITKQPRAYEVK